MAEQTGKTVRTIIGYSVDQNSVAAAVNSSNAVRGGINGIVAATKELQINDRRPLVGLIQYAKDAGILKDKITSANASIKTEREELEKLDTTIKQTTQSTDGLAKATERARDARGRFLPSGSVGVPSAAGGGSTAPLGGDEPLLGGGDSGGGGGTRGSALRLLGSQGRALPSIMTPFGIGTDQISNLVRMAGAIGDITEKAGISTTKLLGAGIATSVLAVALIALTNNAKAAKEAAQADLDARSRALQLIIKGSQEETQARINELAEKRKANEIIAKDANDLVDNLRKNNIKQFGGGAALAAEINSVLGTGAGELSAAKENAEKANKALNETSTELDLLKNASGLAAQGINDVAKAMQNAAFITDDIQNRVSAAQEAYNLELTGTSESLAKRKNDLQNFITINESAITEAKARLETEQLSIQEQQALRDSIDDLTKKSNAYKTTLAFLSDTFVSSTIAAREAAEEASKIRDEQISLVKKFDQDKLSLDEKTGESQTKLYEKLADDQKTIAGKAVEDSAKILATLEGRKADLERNLGRTLQNDAEKRAFDDNQRAIKFQRVEGEEAQKTLDAIVAANQKAQDAITEAGLDRNFAELARLRRQQTAENTQLLTQANNEKAQRLKRFQDENADNAAQDEFNRQQKIKTERQQIEDADRTAREQLNQVEVNKQKQLNATQDKFNREYGILSKGYADQLTALQTALQNNINLTAAGNEGLIKLNEAYYARVGQIIKGNFDAPTPANLGGSVGGKSANLLFKAKGGPLNFGDSAIVNEYGSSGRESFTNNSGQSFQFPGMGIWTPLSRGTVNPGGGGSNITLNMPITVQGADAKAVIAEANRQADQRIAYTLKLMNQRTA